MFYQLEHIGITGYFRKEEGTNFNFPLHLHQSFELIFLDEGTMSVTVNGVPYELQKGETLLIFPNQLHSIRSTDSKHTLFIFSPHIIQSFFEEKKGRYPKSNRLTSLPKEYVQTLNEASEGSSRYKIKGILYLICSLFDEQNEYEAVFSAKEDASSKILMFIENNYTSHCSIEDIAKGTSYSPE